MKPDPLLLSDVKMPWFGARTGYELLPNYLEGFEDDGVIAPSEHASSRLLGKIASILLAHGVTNSQLAGGRVKAALHMIGSGRPVHLLYAEHHLPHWGDFPCYLRDRSLLTIHQPIAWWDKARLRSLSRFRDVILLSSRDQEAFRSYLMSEARISVIRHGVDTEFFHPATTHEPNRILFNGIHLRNIGMFVRVAKRLLALFPDVFIDALVPSSRRIGPDFEDLASLENVVWHEGLDDAGLLSLYQRSRLLLLPLNDSGANTAVVEALACGLPVVTTDVGGIRDYGGGTIFPVVPNDDDVAMVNLVTRYLEDSHFRKKVSDESRQFALEHLAWPLIASLHRQLYNRLWS
jgi:glycosyltransferase involved in cell wall biosynthesis